MREWTDIEVARMKREITIVRPKKGSVSIFHMGEATSDVHKAINAAGGLKEPQKIAAQLQKNGYLVSFR